MIFSIVSVIDTTTGSAVDLAPVLNPLIQLVGAVVTACAGTIAIFAINWVRGKLRMQKLEQDAATQSKIDDIVQKIIGGAMSRAQIKPGQAVIDVKDVVVADAAGKIVQSLGKELTSLGVKDIPQRAQEMVENRIGMMAASAAGTPIPGPTATPMPAAVAQPVAVVPVQPTQPAPGSV